MNIGSLFHRKVTDRRVIDSINIKNVRNIFIFSLIVSITDAISLVIFTASNLRSNGFSRTFINVAVCIAACVLVSVFSRVIIKRYESKKIISDITVNFLVYFFYGAMSVWGIMIDIAHYKAGEQMLTFYIVQFCFLCFVAMKPQIGGILIALSFSSMYINAYFIDGAVGMQPQNYIIFTIIAVIGNAVQYYMLGESESSKVGILDLNRILQQEASIDPLTKLKNRKALRSDFDKYVGKYVHVVMADIDKFKSYNDTYGHVVGDDVLCRIASAIMEIFYDADAYRYGGDEFLIILTDCPEKIFDERMTKWRNAVDSICIKGIDTRISYSFGYEYCLLKDADDLRNAIQTADDRLYDVKKSKLK